MTIALDKIDLRHLGLFRYRQLNGRYLLTNDAGEFLFVSPEEFASLIEGRLDEQSVLYDCLNEKNFLAKADNRVPTVQRYRSKHEYLTRGTSLHIVVITVRCNHNCVYCHASAKPVHKKEYDMTIPTAARVVDAIFNSPSRAITIEFQGGEPLLNWETLRFIVERARRKNRLRKKSLRITLVSNLTLLSEERVAFLRKNQVGLCTSLDGPKIIHDRNRPMRNGASGYDLTTRWIKKLRYAYPLFNSALVTLPRSSLAYPRQIIDEFVKWGFHSIPLRPVSVLGKAGLRQSALGVTAEEFLSFYRRALDYIIELNEITGERFTERLATVCLTKIFTPYDPSYLDLRSPCGAGCGQLAYYYNGDVYTCDEARMLGDEAFKVGNIKTNSYRELVSSLRMKAAVLASCIDGLICDYCVYKPYCGVCPVVNWKEYGTLYARPERSTICRITKGMFDYYFTLLQDKNKARILRSWVS